MAISVILNLVFLSFIIDNLVSKYNIGEIISGINGTTSDTSNKDDFDEKLNRPISIQISNNSDKQGNIYINFIFNDSINGHYFSPQEITYTLYGKRIDSLYQGVMINLNNLTEKNHFCINIDSNNKISGNFIIDNDTVQINENIIVNDSEKPQIEEFEPPKPEKEEKNSTSTSTRSKDEIIKQRKLDMKNKSHD